MASLEEIDSRYIMKSYIAESGEVEAQIEHVALKNETYLYLVFSIGGEFEYTISSAINGEMELTFLDELGYQNTTDIRNLEGDYITVGINKSLDKVKLTEDGTSYSIRDPPDIESLKSETTEEEYQEFGDHLELYRMYRDNVESEYGWKCKIISVNGISEDEFEITVQLTPTQTLTVPIEIPDTRDPSESDVVWLIEELGQGSPNLIEGEYVTVYHDDEDELYLRSLQEGEWHITAPDHYQKRDQLASEHERQQKSNSRSHTSSSSSSSSSIGLIGVLSIIIMVAMLAFTASIMPSGIESEEAINTGSDIVISADHEYPSGTLTFIPQIEAENIIIQASGEQYEITDTASVINLEPDGTENAQYMYTPGETVTVIINSESGQQYTIYYDTTEREGANIGENSHLG